MGKFYDATRYRALRARVDETVLAWPNVRATTMFGCPCYLRHARLFAFLTNGGIVLVGLPAQRLADVTPSTAPFVAGKKRVDAWRALAWSDDLRPHLALIRECYEASATAGASKRRSRAR